MYFFDTDAGTAFVRGHIELEVERAKGIFDEEMFKVEGFGDDWMNEDKFMDWASDGFGRLCAELEWTEAYCLEVADWSPYNIGKLPTKETVDAGLDRLLHKFYLAENIRTGDIDPFQQVKWDNLVDQVSELFDELRAQNRPEEKEPQRTPTSKCETCDIRDGCEGATCERS